MAIIKWNELQLKFDLDLDEAEEDARERAIAPEEARLISEAAANALFKRIEQLGAEHISKPDWFKDFLMLREQGWPWRVACYIAWASSPRNGRWPGTLTELATEVLGLTTPRVVYTWRQKYPSINTTVTMMQAAPLWEHRRDVIEALVTMAKDPDYKAFNDRKLFLEMVGDYTPKSKLDIGRAVKGDGLEEKSDEELRTWIGGEAEVRRIARLTEEEEEEAEALFGGSAIDPTDERDFMLNNGQQEDEGDAGE